MVLLLDRDIELHLIFFSSSTNARLSAYNSISFYYYSLFN